MYIHPFSLPTSVLQNASFPSFWWLPISVFLHAGHLFSLTTTSTHLRPVMNIYMSLCTAAAAATAKLSFIPIYIHTSVYPSTYLKDMPFLSPIPVYTSSLMYSSCILLLLFPLSSSAVIIIIFLLLLPLQAERRLYRVHHDTSFFF